MRRVMAGVYELPDGRRVLRTEWDGPRGGRRYLWELASKDPWGGWVIDGMGSLGRTLREARAELKRQGIAT